MASRGWTVDDVFVVVSFYLILLIKKFRRKVPASHCGSESEGTNGTAICKMWTQSRDNEKQTRSLYSNVSVRQTYYGDIGHLTFCSFPSFQILFVSNDSDGVEADLWSAHGHDDASHGSWLTTTEHRDDIDASGYVVSGLAVCVGGFQAVPSFSNSSTTIGEDLLRLIFWPYLKYDPFPVFLSCWCSFCFNWSRFVSICLATWKIEAQNFPTFSFPVAFSMLSLFWVSGNLDTTQSVYKFQLFRFLTKSRLSSL